MVKLITSNEIYKNRVEKRVISLRLIDNIL